MKLTAILMFSTTMLVSASLYSQSTRLTLNFADISFVDLFQRIEKQSEFRFAFSSSKFDPNQRINVFVEKGTLEEILDMVLPKDITYDIVDRYVVIHNSENVEITQGETESRQQNSVTGKVTDTMKSPLPGVTVAVKGKAQGTVTDANGNFSITNVQPDAVLVFSFVGMRTQEITVAGKTRLEVVLEDETIGLGEVVAIGYGSVKKRDLIGSVSSVNSEMLKDVPVTSAADAITGRMAGVQVTRTEGSPDAEIKIRVRGGGSITQDNSPLYLVDGFPVDNLSAIAPTDIESIDVLKDASSTAIYGARGANGVIIVTTKGGFKGKGKVSYNTYFGIKNVTKYYDVQSPYDYVLYQLETLGPTATKNSFGDFRDFDLYKEMPGTNWQEKVFGQTGTSQYHNLAVSGGSEGTKYSISLTRNDEKEIMVGSGFARTNLTANASHKVNNWLTVDFNTRFSDTRLRGMGTTGNFNRLSSIVQYRPVEGIKSFIDYALGEESDPLYELYIQNPVNQTNDDYQRKNSVTFNLNGAASIRLSKSLTYRISYGNDYYLTDNERFYGIHTYESILKGEQPIVTISNTQARRYRLANTLTYSKKDFMPGHNMNLLAGQELNSYKNKVVSDKSQYFPKYIDPYSALNNMQLGTPDPTNTSLSPDDNLNSYFGRINYDFKGKYLASATLRADGSSKFAPGNQWGYFPSASVGWRISDEKFMQGVSQWLTDLKIRASYGEAGNNRISNNAWQKTFYVSTGPLFAEGNETTRTPFFKANTILSNEKLKWETTITRNLGLDFMLFKQRLNGTVEIYKNTTQDLLIRANIPASTGYSYQWQNIGQTSNKGIELTLNGIIVHKNDFLISASFNIGFNRNRIDNLGELQRWEENSVVGADYDFLVEVGGPIGQMFGYEDDGIYSFDDFDYNADTQVYTLKEGVSNNKAILNANWFGPGTLKLKDQNGDLVVNTDDRVVLGNANPKHTGGFTLNAQYKGLDFSAFFNWVYGNNIYNANKLRWSCFEGSRAYRNLSADMNNFFRTYNPETGTRVYDPNELAELNKDATMWSPNYMLARLHSWIIEDGSFLRLNTLTIGYSLPKKLVSKVGIGQLRVYATGYNLWLWTNYSGFDPEVDAVRSTPLTPGVDWQAYPRSRSFNFGLNVEF
jgi:TonB-linked SusC/RagA family outer membrane protein